MKDSTLDRLTAWFNHTPNAKAPSNVEIFEAYQDWLTTRKNNAGLLGQMNFEGYFDGLETGESQITFLLKTTPEPLPDGRYTISFAHKYISSLVQSKAKFLNVEKSRYITLDEIVTRAFDNKLGLVEAVDSLMFLAKQADDYVGEWETSYWLTNGGSVLCKDRLERVWFSRPNGEFIRMVDRSEFEYLITVCPKITGLDIVLYPVHKLYLIAVKEDLVYSGSSLPYIIAIDSTMDAVLGRFAAITESVIELQFHNEIKEHLAAYPIGTHTEIMPELLNSLSFRLWISGPC